MSEELASAYIRIRPETSDFRGDADRDIKAALEGVDGRVKVDADTGEADAKLDDTKAKLDRIDRTTSTAKVKVDDQGGGLSLLGLLAGFTPALGTIATAGAGVGAGLAGGFATAGVAAGAFGLVAKSAVSGATAAAGQLTAAQTALNKAEASGNTKTIATDLLAYQQALTKVTPAQAAFTAQLAGTGAAYKSAIAQVTPQVLTVLGSGLRDVTPALSALPGLVAAVAPAVAGLGDEVGGFVQSPAFVRFTSFIETDGPKDLTLLGQSFLHFGGISIAALQALAPLSDEVLGGLDSGLAKIEARIAGGGLSGFVRTAQTDLPLVGRSLGDIATAAVHLLEAVAPLGPPLLNVVDSLAHVVDEAEPAVKQIVGGLTPALDGLADVLHVLGPELGPVAVDAGLLFAAFKAGGVVKDAVSSLKDATSGTSALGKGYASLGAAGPTAAVGVGALTAGLLAYQYAATVSADATKQANALISDQQARTVLNNAASYQTAAINLDAYAASSDKAADHAARFIDIFQAFADDKKSSLLQSAAEAAERNSFTISDNLDTLSFSLGKSQTTIAAFATSAGVDLSKPLSQVGPELGVLSEFAGDSSTQLQLLGQAFVQLHPKAGQTTSDINAITQAYNTFFAATTDVKLGVIETGDAFTQALSSATKQLSSNRAGLSSNTAAAQANRTALEGAVTALDAHITSLERAHKPQSVINAAYATGYTNVTNLAASTQGAAGASSALVKALPTPKQFDDFAAGVDTANTAVGRLATSLSTLNAQGNAFSQLLSFGIPGVTGSAPSASTSLLPFQQALVGQTPHGVPRVQGPHASGGFVEGPFGTPQMVIAHAGELILNPNQQQAVTALGLHGGDPQTIVLLKQLVALAGANPQQTGAHTAHALNGVASHAAVIGRTLTGSARY